MTAVCRALVLVLVLVGAGDAHAQGNATAADEAFKHGRQLYKANKFAEACEQFEKSQQLDPANGTLFNIGQCSERIGKLATAVASYRAVVANDANAERKASAADRLKALTPRVPKLLVKIGSPPPGLVVEIAGKTGARAIEANQAVEVDFGDYTVVARARGYSEFTSRVKVNHERRTTTIDAALKPDASKTETVGGVVQSGRPDKPDKPARSNRRLYGIVGMGTGGAVLAGGVVFGVLARSKWSEAKDVCGGMTCTSQADVDRANELGDRARSKATLSTLLVLGGAAIAGVGAYLYVSAPGETTISPSASEGGGSVTIRGVF